MAKNNSANQTTIKTMMNAMDSDIWTIDKFLYYCNYDNTAILPDGLILDDYYDYFVQYLVDVDVPEKFFYSPSGFSEFLYGTPDLDFLILYFANMGSLFEFNKSTIKALPKSRLNEINQLATFYKDAVKESSDNPTQYTANDRITLRSRIKK